MIVDDWELLVRGGRLYDKWWHESGSTKPGARHPAYPRQKKIPASATWRCKQCHGWDYLGSAGAYSSGKHFTGIAGISGSVGQSPAKIRRQLMKPTHDFLNGLSKQDRRALVLFVSKGQIDMDKYINRKTGLAKGNAGRGGRYFVTICARCHGKDGRKINFHATAKDPEYIGTVGKHNPWEALHKIRFGQPATQMPAMLALPIQDQIDILAYMQTLPEK